MVNEAVRLRFMARSAASWAEGTLHVLRRAAKRFIYHILLLRLTMKHCSAYAPQYEATPLSLRYEALGIRLV